jgi:hypothetical protein
VLLKSSLMRRTTVFYNEGIVSWVQTGRTIFESSRNIAEERDRISRNSFVI